MLRSWIAVVLCALVLVSGEPALAHIQRPAERRMSQLINRARDRRDLHHLRHGTRLHRYGRAQAARMAACRCIKHAPRPPWCIVAGQVVGIATSADGLFLAFMASPVHRSVLLDPRFRRMGVGAKRAGGFLYVAVELCR